MVAVHRYTLHRRDGSGSRDGALLSIDGGYADLHPWESLGDLPLADQLARLARGARTTLLDRALATARLDADARAAGTSLFAGLEVPESHALVTNGDLDEVREFGRVKIKTTSARLCEDLRRVTDELPESTRLRIDLNGQGDRFWEVIEPYRDRIDFVEDPYYERSGWAAMPATCVRLARDRARDDAGRAAVRILKPAVDDPQTTDWDRAVVTSYLDHPLGQVAAAYWAARLAFERPGHTEAAGVLAHLVYEENAFSEWLTVDGARLVPPGGTGLGFDDLLGRIAWTRLV